MQFCFYPTHEHNCSNVKHCPHLGGAAIGSLVMIANHSGTTIAELHCRLDAEREVNSRLVAENLRLEEALHQAKLELKLERQNKFATNELCQFDNHANGARGIISRFINLMIGSSGFVSQAAILVTMGLV